ncbi:MAG: hypothetical protein MI861_13485, partial [Pirellulales bacterium]|nr:hypothetical protein [Pirellulales bacterium]
KTVWLSRLAFRGEPRVSSTECPVSVVSGESAAWVQLFLASERFGDASALKERPAREVEAMALLEAERQKWRAATHGE